MIGDLAERHAFVEEVADEGVCEALVGVGAHACIMRENGRDSMGKVRIAANLRAFAVMRGFWVTTCCHWVGKRQWAMGNGEGKRGMVCMGLAAPCNPGSLLSSGRVGGLRPAPTKDVASRQTVPDPAATFDRGGAGCALGLATIARCSAA
jgi:hypothetical protein